MKNLSNKLLLFTALFSLSVISCRKQLDINQNPNDVTESNITADLILPNALHGVGVQTANGYGWLANWMGYWSPSGSFAPSTEESTYNISSLFGEAKWAGVYNVLYDLETVDNKSTAGNQRFYKALAKIMKAHLYQNLVDIWGDVPYSEAFKIPEVRTPKYDKAEDIYADLQVRLDTAINILKVVSVSELNAAADIVYGGDTDLWIRLANTIKLRLLIRQSEVNPNPTAELAKIKANGGVLQSGESAEVNPGYLNGANKQNPFYATYGRTPTNTEANAYYRANNYVLQILKSTSDPRLGLFFAKAESPTNQSNPYVGTTYGALPDDNLSGGKTSNIGPGLAKSAEQAQWIVTSVESMFLQAEAIARGWDIGGPYAGNAQAAFEAAVTESFNWLGVANATTAAESYMDATATANWANAGATMMDRVKFVVFQKYIALTGINPLEAWADYRRLNVPNNLPLSVHPGRTATTLPVRLLYPQRELAVNQQNVPSGVNQFTSKIFWDVN
jgi:hypothetical protein